MRRAEHKKYWCDSRRQHSISGAPLGIAGFEIPLQRISSFDILLRTILERVSAILVGAEKWDYMNGQWDDEQHSISGGAPLGIAGFEIP